MNTLRIVNYHKILKCNFYDVNLNLRVFEKHLKFYKKYFNIISLSEAKNKNSFRNNLCITFDDGFSENHNLVLPLLKKYNVKATFFLISDCIDNNDLMWRNRIIVSKNNSSKSKFRNVINDFNDEFNQTLSSDNYMGESMNWKDSNKDLYTKFIWENSMDETVEEYLYSTKVYLTSNQIHEILSYGHEIGNHSKTHPNNKNLDYQGIQREYINTNKFLENKFGVKVKHLAYPFGIPFSHKYEEVLTSNTSVQKFHYINDLLINKPLSKRWYRVSMEFGYRESLKRFYFLTYKDSIKYRIKKYVFRN